MSACEVGAKELEDLVVVEEAVELLQLGLEAQAESWGEVEQIDRLVAVLEHAIA